MEKNGAFNLERIGWSLLSYGTCHKKWDKITDQLQKITKLKVPHNGKTYKDKWNGLNSDYKKVSNYLIRIGHHITF
jgi:hypothetical protein